VASVTGDLVSLHPNKKINTHLTAQDRIRSLGGVYEICVAHRWHWDKPQSAPNLHPQKAQHANLGLQHRRAQAHRCPASVNASQYKLVTGVHNEKSTVLRSNLASFLSDFVILRGTRQRVWLEHYTTNRNVGSSIPDEVCGSFFK
jgi:hypothetical protein